jgi:protein ImuB
MALRLFRPPLAAQVELQDGRPARVEARRARSPAVRGSVTSAAGPWRTSGDWWTDHPWEHDEWDVEIRSVVRRPLSVAGFQGKSRAERTEEVHLYRIYCDLTDGRWFLEGLYD